MGSLASMFREGGLFAYVVLATGISAFGLMLLLIVVNVLPIKTRKRMAIITVSILTLGAVAVSFGAGLIGYFIGVDNMMSAVEKMTPENAARMKARGEELVWIPMRLAIYFNSVPLIVGILSLIRGIRIPKT